MLAFAAKVLVHSATTAPTFLTELLLLTASLEVNI
jgi:hypothetical protein